MTSTKRPLQRVAIALVAGSIAVCGISASPMANAATASKKTTVIKGDPGTLVKAESVREKAASDAKVVGQVAGGDSVTVIERSGGWYHIAAGKTNGWVRMLSVRKSASSTSSSLAGIAGVASGRTGTGNIVTTTGVRGLDNGELAAAAFSEEQILKAEKNRVSRATADAFAKAGKLTTRDVGPLPAPAK